MVSRSCVDHCPVDQDGGGSRSLGHGMRAMACPACPCTTHGCDGQIHKTSDGATTFWARSLKPSKESLWKPVVKHLDKAMGTARDFVIDAEILLVDRETYP